jgi:flagellar protein FlaJ
MFKPLAERNAPRHTRLQRSLEKAHMPERVEIYLSFLYMISAIALVEGLFVSIVILLVLPAAGIEVPVWATLVGVLCPLLLPLLVFTIGRVWPEIRAAERAAKIEYALPGALSYMAAMASSGMTPDKILASLGRQDVYGEAAQEAHWISSQVKWMGKDVLSALREAMPRTPSSRLQDVWQGMESTIASGASLKSYLLSKAEQMHSDNASQQRIQLENLGVLAESFLVVAVCAPILFIIMLTVMASAGPGAATTRVVLWLVVLVMLPASQFGFALAVNSMRGRLS